MLIRFSEGRVCTECWPVYFCYSLNAWKERYTNWSRSGSGIFTDVHKNFFIFSWGVLPYGISPSTRLCVTFWDMAALFRRRACNCPHRFSSMWPDHVSCPPWLPVLYTVTDAFHFWGLCFIFQQIDRRMGSRFNVLKIVVTVRTTFNKTGDVI